MRHRRTAAVRLALGSASLIALALLPTLGGCLNRPINPLDSRLTSVVYEAIPSPIDKIDILLDIDNSSSMADKQAILAAAVPDLVKRLVNPYCLDAKGNPDPVQPAGPKDPCTGPTSEREFIPVGDIHVGIIDSSLGGFTSDECKPGSNSHMDDQGHLVARSNNNTQTFQNQGFLAWDSKTGDLTQFSRDLSSLVAGVGQDGCGFENQLEAAVRFLVDPKPYDSIVRNGLDISRSGTDQNILTQRADFLRPDSLLVIVALSDEDEHSINTLAPKDYIPINSAPNYRATSVCATNPTDKCCSSCEFPAPDGCPPVANDASCMQNGGKYTSDAEDPIYLRQDRMKQQYGYEGRFPVKRYVNAFTQKRIDPTKADLAVDPANSKAGVPNPIFQNLSGKIGRIRTPDLVYFAAITGVPFEDIAVDKTDISKGFKSFGQLSADGFWAADVGDPDNFVPPTNPIMQESGAKRPGVGPGAPNGGDRSLDPTHPPDFQYACIFKLAKPDPMGAACVMNGTDSNDNPLCTQTNGIASEPQIAAKAYPGIRELAVVEGMQAQGIAASICPANPTDETNQATFGYNPAVLSIVEQLRGALNQQCLPRQLSPDAKGDVPCVIIEATHEDGGQSQCDQPGRSSVPKQYSGAVDAARVDPEGEDLGWNSFCLITSLEGNPTDPMSDRFKCQNLATNALPSSGLDGWCYVDATTDPPTGNPDLASRCGSNEKRLIRFVGKGQVQPGGTALVSCSVDSDTP